MTKYTFEMYSTITEQTTVEAESYKEARNILDSGDCKWEEVSSEGGELALVSQSLQASIFQSKTLRSHSQPVTLCCLQT